MRQRPLVDFTFGIKSQAMAVLHELNAQEAGFEVDDISTRPWYNGRERGVLICVQNRFAETALCVAVFEHRISDDIHVVHWEQPVGINIPTGWDTCDQAAYARSVPAEFKCGEAYKAAAHIIEGIKRWVHFERVRLEAKKQREGDSASVFVPAGMSYAETRRFLESKEE